MANVSQAIMDQLNQLKNKATQELSDATNQATAANAAKATAQDKLDSINNIIAEAVVVANP